MFCFAALQALAVAFAALLGRLLPAWQDRAVGLPVVGAVEVLSLAACAPAAGVVVAWVLGRHAWWAWPLQDAMGVSLMLLLLRQFRLPNIKARLPLFVPAACMHLCRARMPNKHALEPTPLHGPPLHSGGLTLQSWAAVCNISVQLHSGSGAGSTHDGQPVDSATSACGVSCTAVLRWAQRMRRWPASCCRCASRTTSSGSCWSRASWAAPASWWRCCSF